MKFNAFACACAALLVALAGCATSPRPKTDPRASQRSETEQSIREACEKGDWAQAQKLCRVRLASEKNARAQVDNGTRLAIVSWNAGERLAAVIAMDAVVSASVGFGEECERLARIFRNAFRAGAVPERFTLEEVSGSVGMTRALLDAVDRSAARGK